MTALVLIDLQNDFLPGGALAVPDGHAVIPIANRLQHAFDLVVATQDWHPPNHASFASRHPGRKPFDQIQLHGLPQTLWPDHCVQGSHGAELAPALRRDRLTRIFQKGADPQIDSYSAFFDNGHRRSTGLGEWLREKGVLQVYLCGLATDYCVQFSALDALPAGFDVFLIEDACRGVDLQPGDVSRALEAMRRAGVKIIQSGDVLAAPAHPFEKTILHTGKFLSLIKEGHWEYAERVNASGAAIIVALTDDQKLLLVEQYRIPLHRRTIELPAGIAGDEPGASTETLAAAAQRELLEETGYAAARTEILTTGPSSAGLSSELVTFVRATGLKRAHAGGGVGRENITVHEIPLASVQAWLAAREREGLMIEPKVFAGLYFLLRP